MLYSRGLEFQVNVRNGQTGDDCKASLDPPQDVERDSSAAAILQHGQLDDFSICDRNARQTRCLHNVNPQLMSDVFRVHQYSEGVDDQTEAEENDGVYPNDLGEDHQSLELVIQLVEKDADDSRSLGYQKPVGGEVPQRDGEWPLRTLQ